MRKNLLNRIFEYWACLNAVINPVTLLFKEVITTHFCYKFNNPLRNKMQFSHKINHTICMLWKPRKIQTNGSRKLREDFSRKRHTKSSIKLHEYLIIIQFEWRFCISFAWKIFTQFAWTVCLYFAHRLNRTICVVCTKILYVFCAVIARNFSVGSHIKSHWSFIKWVTQ